MMSDNRAQPLGGSTDGHWEHFSHDADIGVRGVGTTKEVAFAQAALALSAVVSDLATVEAREAVQLRCDSPDDGLLLVEWLNAVVFEMATRRMLFSRFQVRCDGPRLEATAWGEAVDRARHEPAAEVKGATMTALSVGKRPDGLWMAQCVVDV
jgi:tRNA nucleotidyltransferase (CCA-adding enzyme)